MAELLPLKVEILKFLASNIYFSVNVYGLISSRSVSKRVDADSSYEYSSQVCSSSAIQSLYTMHSLMTSVVHLALVTCFFVNISSQVVQGPSYCTIMLQVLKNGAWLNSSTIMKQSCVQKLIAQSHLMLLVDENQIGGFKKGMYKNVGRFYGYHNGTIYTNIARDYKRKGQLYTFLIMVLL